MKRCAHLEYYNLEDWISKYQQFHQFLNRMQCIKRWITIFSVKICMSNSRGLYWHITKKSIGSQLDCCWCASTCCGKIQESHRQPLSSAHLWLWSSATPYAAHLHLSIKSEQNLGFSFQKSSSFSKKSSCICTVWWLLQRKTVVDAYCIEKLLPPCPISTSNLHFPKGVHMALSFPLPRAGLAQ